MSDYPQGTERQTDQRVGRRAHRKALAAIVLFVGFIACITVFEPSDLYLWMKAFHIVAVISWMAGLLYLPRLFIYHTDAAPGSAQSETFKVMEQRLLTVIMAPAMMITWVLGLYLAWTVYGFQGGWLHAKLALVAILTGVHMHYSAAARRFRDDGPRRTARYWRMVNEVPALLMIAIVILVVVKPF